MKTKIGQNVDCQIKNWIWWGQNLDFEVKFWTNVGFWRQTLVKHWMRTYFGQVLDIYWTKSGHRTKSGQTLEDRHWQPAPIFVPPLLEAARRITPPPSSSHPVHSLINYAAECCRTEDCLQMLCNFRSSNVYQKGGSSVPWARHPSHGKDAGSRNLGRSLLRYSS